MKSKVVLAAVVLAFLSAGCYRTVYKGENLANFATLNGPRQGETTVEHFRIKKWNHYFLSGLVPTATLDITDVFTGKMQPGHAVRNLSIRHQRSFPNMFVSWLALGGLIYSPMTTIIEGDIVRINGSDQTVARPAAAPGSR